MKKIAIYGAGGFGKDVLFLLESINKVETIYDITGFYDDNYPKSTIISKYPVLGNLDDLNNVSEPTEIVIAISKPQVIEKIVSKITNSLISYPNIYHPTTVADVENINIGTGNIFNVGCIIARDVTIGNFNSFNTRTALGHDVSVGNYNHFGPNVQISGGVLIENSNTFGLNSSVIQYKKIGSFNSIGACSLVIRNVANNKSLFGIPALNKDF